MVNYTIINILKGSDQVSKRKIVININFNLMQATEERLSEEWIDYRIGIFTDFTRRSLEQQTNQDFLCLLRYEEESEAFVHKALAKYPLLPNNIKFVTKKQYKSPFMEYINSSDEFYIVRLDSDNLYHKTYIQQLYDYQPRERTIVLICQEGYVYDSEHHRLARWYNESPPFFTFIYKTASYLKGDRHTMRGGHAAMIKYCHEMLPVGNFMVLIHGRNTMGHFNSPWRRELIEDSEQIASILKDFKGS